MAGTRRRGGHPQDLSICGPCGEQEDWHLSRQKEHANGVDDRCGRWWWRLRGSHERGMSFPKTRSCGELRGAVIGYGADRRYRWVKQTCGRLAAGSRGCAGWKVFVRST